MNHFFPLTNNNNCLALGSQWTRWRRGEGGSLAKSECIPKYPLFFAFLFLKWDELLKNTSQLSNSSCTSEKTISMRPFSYESTFISYICICTPKVKHLLICRNSNFMHTIDPGKNSCPFFFLLFFSLIVSLPHVRSAFTSESQQLYKEPKSKSRSDPLLHHLLGSPNQSHPFYWFGSVRVCARFSEANRKASLY